ncbi:hypothetical protein D3C72_2377690 [compost metagenome]
MGPAAAGVAAADVLAGAVELPVFVLLEEQATRDVTDRLAATATSMTFLCFNMCKPP